MTFSAPPGSLIISQYRVQEKRIHLTKDKPNITRMLDALERKRLIFRQPDPRDRRKFCIYLTKEGKQLHERLFPLVRALRDRAIKDLSQSEIDLMKKFLDRINRNIGNI